MKKLAILFVTHMAVGIAGIGVGIYLLPILTAPPAPSADEATTALGTATYEAQFRRDLKGSDFFHWGEGKVYLRPSAISLHGRLAPGPDYKLYLSPAFVETEEAFEQIKPKMVLVGDVRTFENFVVPVPEGIDPDKFNTVVVWCESFSQFITAARYQ
jgi:hypothetical protein